MKSPKLIQIEEAWFAEVQKFNTSPAIRRLIAGELTLAHYQSLLREIYFYARESPQFFAMIPVYLRGAQREFTKQMLQHACSEAGHDHLALNDLRTLGVNVDTLPYERPLPETAALIGFSYYLIQYLNPVSYLGFVFHLEYLPTHFGEQYGRGLLGAGIPPAAMTFIGEHIEADVGHNRLMAEYVDNLLVTERDVEDVIYAMRVTANLYAKVFEAAFCLVDEGQTYDYGINQSEIQENRYEKTIIETGHASQQRCFQS